jgi:hypothetical protein
LPVLCAKVQQRRKDDSPTAAPSYRRNSHRTHFPQDNETGNDERGTALAPSQARANRQITPLIAMLEFAGSKRTLETAQNVRHPEGPLAVQ